MTSDHRGAKHFALAMIFAMRSDRREAEHSLLIAHCSLLFIQPPNRSPA
jgi:hypothetical protein